MLEFSLNAPNVPNVGGVNAATRLPQIVDRWVAFNQEAVTYGINHFTVAHHWISHPNVFLEPWPLIGYLTHAVPTATISGFIAAPLYNPVDLAEKIATLDVLSKGKFVFRAGVGWREEEFYAIGAEVSSRGRRMEEIIEVCKLLWDGGVVDYEGRYYHLKNAQMSYSPLQRPHPPLWIAAQSEAAIRRAARIGDAPWIPLQVGNQDIATLMRHYRDELEKAGKPYPKRLPMMKFISVDPDERVAGERLRPITEWFKWYGKSPSFTKVKINYTHEENLRDRALAGTPASVVERLLRFHEDFGVTVFDLFTVWPSHEPAAVSDHLAYIGCEVVAPLRAALSLGAAQVAAH